MLEISGLTVTMAGHTIVKSISMQLAPASIVAVLGANGAGKTTLLRAVSGIYPARSGTVTLLGRDITNEAPHRIVLEGLAHAPEGRQIFATMKVRENLVLGATAACPRKLLPDLLESVLHQFPVLKQKLDHAAGGLSGGEQQMLCIGRALMSRPKVLLMDEPSLGLAPKVVRQIFELIGAVRASGVAILLVEQNAAAALAVADWGYVVEGGRVVHADTSSSLRGDAKVQAAYLGGTSG